MSKQHSRHADVQKHWARIQDFITTPPRKPGEARALESLRHLTAVADFQQRERSGWELTRDIAIQRAESLEEQYEGCITREAGIALIGEANRAEAAYVKARDELAGLREQLQTVEQERDEYLRQRDHDYARFTEAKQAVIAADTARVELQEQLEAIRTEVYWVRADCGICNGGVTEIDCEGGVCPNCGELWRLVGSPEAPNPATLPDVNDPSRPHSAWWHEQRRQSEASSPASEPS